MNNFGKIIGTVAVTTVIAYGVSNSAIREQIGGIKEKISNTGISNKKFKQLENRLGNAPLIDGPGCSSKTATKWQEALDSIKLEGVVKKAYLEGAQAVRDSLAKASKSI